MCKIPVIKRARANYLYAEDGRRFVDLCQAGGGALLGAKPSALTRVLKNCAERGLFSPYPSFAQRKLEKALARLFPARCFRVYKDTASAESALAGLKDAPRLGALPRYRPFGGEASLKAAQSDIFVPVIPFPLSPAALVIKSAYDSLLRHSDVISPVIAACSARAIDDLIASDERDIKRFPLIEKALAKNSLWYNDGIYIYDKRTEGRAERAVRFLEEGFVIPESPEDPLILPAELSQNEEKKLAALFSAL